jgi:gamma-glutamyltranspeptidase/glutathione hydrolase
MVIVDRYGNVVSMTTTVESVFGSGRMVEGYFLNNQLTDFSFAPTTSRGLPAANAVAGRKRPRSSMAPVIVFDAQGKFLAALGSPGGSAILAYNLKSIVGTFDWGLSMQDAFNLPNVIARGNLALGELDGFDPVLLSGLRDQGVELLQPRGEQSGLHGLMLLPDGRLSGAADKRREGVVLIH